MSSISVSAIDVAILVASMVLTLVVGVVMSRAAARSVDDYFLGGRRIPWWVLGVSGAASNFDLTGTMLTTSFLFALGFQGYWIETRGALVLSLPVYLAFMAKWLRRTKVMTSAEFMELRFGTGRGGQSARLLAAIANLVIVIGAVIYSSKGTGAFAATFLPFSETTCSIFFAAVALTYAACAGLYGVAYTDFFQFVIMFGSAVVIIVYAFGVPDATVAAAAPAGWTDLAPQATAEPMYWLADPAVYHLFGACVVYWMLKQMLDGFAGGTGGYMPQRFYACKDERSAGLMSGQWALLMTVRWGMMAGCAVLALSLAAGDPALGALLHDNPERTLPIVLSEVLPVGVKGLALAGLIAAELSTVESVLNAGAAYWVKDIYHRFLRPTAPQRELVHQSYLATISLAACGVILAIGVKNIDQIWNWITGPLAAGLLAPMVLRWYWWRMNGAGFAAGTGVGLAAAVLFGFGFPGLPFFVAVPLTLALSVAAALATSWLSAPVDRELLDRFYREQQPFGLWGPMAAGLDPVARRARRRETRLDLANVVVATVWQMSLYGAITMWVMRDRPTAAVLALVAVATSVILYWSWFRKLPSSA